MINPVAGSAVSAVMQMPSAGRNESLTDDQRELLESTLSEFDAENLTAEDAQEIVAIFEEAGIKPGREMEELMSAQGFDARTVGELAGVEGSARSGQKPPPEMQGGPIAVDEDSLSELNQLLDQYYSESATDSDKQSTLDAMNALFKNASVQGNLVDGYA